MTTLAETVERHLDEIRAAIRQKYGLDENDSPDPEYWEADMYFAGASPVTVNFGGPVGDEILSFPLRQIIQGAIRYETEKAAESDADRQDSIQNLEWAARELREMLEMVRTELATLRG